MHEQKTRNYRHTPVAFFGTNQPTSSAMSNIFESQKKKQIIANSLENQDYLLISSLNVSKASNLTNTEKQAINMSGPSSVAQARHNLLTKYCGN
ncbi:hypothetical protein DASC09_004670 [Saccharomycopsis crataegensis]|uniref:Uncharacterized protein n=1 Tax=Saccharomycopsis crataegensis TaxID=43959 RepID=A0AAV5QER2_9ASCO|nr:hypothetical protein DASC09_004670 [Saccharomycopsis crataegensis]